MFRLQYILYFFFATGAVVQTTRVVLPLIEAKLTKQETPLAKTEQASDDQTPTMDDEYTHHDSPVQAKQAKNVVKRVPVAHQNTAGQSPVDDAPVRAMANNASDGGTDGNGSAGGSFGENDSSSYSSGSAGGSKRSPSRSQYIASTEGSAQKDSEDKKRGVAAVSGIGASKEEEDESVVPTSGSSSASTATKISSVTSTLANGSYTVGQVVPIQITFATKVTVTGTPQLTLETGTMDRTADYMSGSGTADLIFNYTVQASDESADLDYSSKDALILNSGKIKDNANKDVSLTLPVPGTVDSLGASKAIVIDTTAPSAFVILGVSGSTDTTDDDYLTAGSFATISWNTAIGASSYDVVIRNATDSADVCSVQNTTLTYFNFSTCLLMNTTSYIAKVTAYDLAGNATSDTGSGYAFTVYTTLPVLSFAGEPTGSNAVTTLNVTVAGVAVTKYKYKVGADGATDCSSATGYSAEIDPATLITSDITAVIDGTVKLCGIGKNVAGVWQDLGSATSVTWTKDTANPTMAITKKSGQSASTNTLPIEFTVTFSKAISGASFTTADISNTGTAAGITWSIASVSSTVYTLSATVSGQGTLIPQVAASGVTDTTGLSNLAATTSSDTVTYDTVAPTVTGVTSSTSNNSYKLGDTVSIQVTFTKSVIVTGTPQITLETGATDRAVNYTSGSSSNTLTFVYTVQAGDTSSDLDYVSNAALSLNSGTIQDSAGNNATLTLAAPGAANSLGANKAIVIDTTAPNAPTLALQTPATSPNVIDTPVIRVSGVIATDVVTLYSDVGCTTAVGSAATASGITVDITATTLASHGTYNYYARVADAAGNISACSAALNYVYTDFPTVQFSASTQSFNANVGALEGAWDASMSAWLRKIKLTFNNSSNSETLTNFPVLVVLNSTRVNYSDFKANGDDIRFVDSSGTLLSYEIETWNTSGNSYIWVNVPSITGSSSTSYINMYFKNAAASAGSNASGTWDSNFKSVYHFAGNTNDSTSNALHLTNVGTTAGTGKVGSGRDFNGSNQNLYLNSTPTITAPFTVGGWVKVSDTNWRCFFGSRGPSDASFDAKLGSGNVIHGDIGNGSGWITTSADASFAYSTGTWYYITYVVTTTGYKIYANGNQVGTGTFGANSPLLGDANHKFSLGSYVYWGGEWFYGSMDEVSISNVARTPGWNWAMNSSMKDEFITYRMPETITNGQVTITAQASFAFSSNITIPVTVSGTAVYPTDHNLANGNLTITAGQTSGQLAFKYYRDGSMVINKTIIATMGTPTNATSTSPSVQTITIVAPGNTAPVAAADSISVSANSSSNVINVLSNDSDVDADNFTVTSVGAASHGTVVNNTTFVSYTPSFEYSGADSFTYTITDVYGATSTATVSVTVVPSPFTWTGATGNNTWSTGGNWYGGNAPGAGDVAHFTSTECTGANCNVSIASNMSVAGISAGSGYAGTITQNAGVTLTIGTSGWVHAAGTFAGGNSAIAISGPLALSGGTFTSTSGTLQLANSVTVSGSPTFNHNSGLTYFKIPYNSTVSLTPGSIVLNNLLLQADSWYDGFVLTTSGTLNVAGNLQIAMASGGSVPTFNGGTFAVAGNVTFSGTFLFYGNTLVKMVNSAGATLTGGGTTVPMLPIEIASTGGVTSIVGTPYFAGGFRLTSGTLDWSAATDVYFGGRYGLSANISTGSTSLNNVHFLATSAWDGYSYTLLSDMNVAGNFSLEFPSGSSPAYLYGSNINVAGNITVSGQNDFRGTTNVVAAGNGNQSISMSVSTGIPCLTIASTGGTVTMTGTGVFRKNLTYTSGTVVATAFNAIFNPYYAQTQSISSGPIVFNDVTFSGVNWYDGFTSTITGTLYVNGNLSMSSLGGTQFTVNGGTISVNGNVSASGTVVNGTTAVVMTGTANATITSSATGYALFPGTVTINKTGGAGVTLATHASFNRAGQSLTVTSGSVDMAGYNMTINNSLSLNGNTLTKSGGTLSVGGSAVGTGSLHGGTINP